MDGKKLPANPVVAGWVVRASQKLRKASREPDFFLLALDKSADLMQSDSSMSDEAMSNFTPRAQQVLALARKEADRLNHNFLGTEHLLLGLI